VTVLAHGIGGRQDLPIPFSYALIGAALALVVSFVALAALWREPRLGGVRTGAALPTAVQRGFDAPVTRWALRLLGLAATAYVVVAATAGPDLAINPTAGVVYVLFWVGLAPASVLLGPVWRLLNPLRTLHLLLARALRTDPDEGLRPLPPTLGYWPAAASLVAFVWLELAAPDRATLPVLRLFFAVYAACHLVAAAVYGQRWFDRGDGFEVYSTLLGRMAPLQRRADGRLALRSPLDGLASVRPAPGLSAVVLVLLGSTAYDGLSNAPVWVRVVNETTLSTTAIATLGVFLCITVVTVLYAAAVAATARLGARSRSGAEMPEEFAASLVPIAFGYLVAHYYSLLVLEGQRTLIRLSDPLSNGSDVFGTAERGVDASLVTPSGVATLQVAAVVTGHVLGVVLAHDRAIELLPRRHALAGQLPLLCLMVAYTVGGLLLLFAG
jgi:hypothetical protein